MATFVSSTSNGRSAIDDLSSPYFLHHSDSPGLSLVSQPLTGDNYSSWSRAMLIALSVKNKMGFVDGSLSKPTGSRKDRPYCTHCNFHGHTIEKCYKLHGYPPGFKPKQEGQNSGSTTPINHVAIQAQSSEGGSMNQGNFFQNLSSAQYQQLMEMFSTYLGAKSPDSAPPDATSSTYVAGYYQQEDGWQG